MPESNPATCAELNCASLDTAQYLELEADMYYGMVNALTYGDQSCWEIFNKGYSKLVNNEVYQMRDTVYRVDTTANGIESSYVGGYWRRDGAQEIYIWKQMFQTPSERARTMVHEALHALMGPPQTRSLEVQYETTAQASEGCYVYSFM